MTVSLRDPQPGDKPQWSELWLAYLTFYEAPEYGRRTESLWSQLHDPDHPFRCRVAADGDELVGIVHFVEHHDTWFEDPIIYLADLFVRPERRGEGIARQLIDDVAAFAKANGNEQVYWHTNDTNATARGLYDTMTGGPNGFIMYELPIEAGTH